MITRYQYFGPITDNDFFLRDHNLSKNTLDDFDQFFCSEKFRDGMDSFILFNVSFEDDDGLETMLKSLQKVRTIKLIRLERVQINYIAADCIFSLMTEKSVEGLHIGNCDLDKQILQSLEVVLDRCVGKIKSLSLRKVCKDTEGFVNLSNVVKMLQLELLHLYDNRMNVNVLTNVVNAAMSQNLRSLKFNKTGMTQDIFNMMCSGLQNLPLFEILMVKDDGIENIDAMSKVVEHCPNLKSLNLGGVFSSLGNLPVALSRHLRIEHIKLSSMMLHDDAVRDLLTVTLYLHISLKIIDLSRTRVDENLQDDINMRIEILHSTRSQQVFALISGKLPRMANRNAVQRLPIELIRLIADHFE